jgi:8-amino-7-oxononanoate synthase
MNPFNHELNRRLGVLRQQGLRRNLRRVDSAQGPRIKTGGKTLLNFSSNDYLGLASHPALKKAAADAVKRFGAGAGASRLVSGSLAPFHELEETLAAFKKTEAALSFSTGYAAAIGTICALLGKSDIIIIDKLVHACIVDAARLSGATLRVFDHNDLEDLEKILLWTSKISLPRYAPRERFVHTRVLIVTESIFSMDGDAAPLREIVALKNKYGAWLMVDEAHATGIIGKNGRGLADALGVAGEIDIQMGTLGKALGSSGGYICGSRVLIDFLVNSARSFIFSTAPVPAAAAAATAAIRLVQSPEGRALNKHLWKQVKTFHSALRIPHSAMASAIIPLIIGNEAKAVGASSKLRAQNIFIPAIRYPTVARGRARLRVTITAAHKPEDISHVAFALNNNSDHWPRPLDP